MEIRWFTKGEHQGIASALLNAVKWFFAVFGLT
jgi:hypothetical protein